MAVWPSSRGSVNEMSVRPVAAAETFCTTMSMLTSAAASASKIRAASPTLSGTPTTVILASLRSWATPAMMACSISSPSVVGDDPGAFLLAEGGAHVDGHVVAAGVLDAAQVQDLGARGGHLQHLLGGEPVELAGGGHDPRVGGEDAVDVGVDLAHLGTERGRQRHRGGVGRAAAERGDVLGVLGDALEAGHDGDVAGPDGVLDPARRDVDDLGLAVRGVGDHAGLGAGERLRLVAELGDRHRDQRHRDPLAGGEQHVELARRRQRRHLLGEVAQLVGGVAHRGDDHDDVVARPAGVDDPLGDPLDAGRVRDRRSAVLLHDNAHWSVLEARCVCVHQAAPPTLRARLLALRPQGAQFTGGWFPPSGASHRPARALRPRR